jgi:hypothetical protein
MSWIDNTSLTFSHNVHQNRIHSIKCFTDSVWVRTEMQCFTDSVWLRTEMQCFTDSVRVRIEMHFKSSHKVSAMLVLTKNRMCRKKVLTKLPLYQI